MDGNRFVVGRYVGSFGPFDTLAAEVGELYEDYSNHRERYGDDHFHTEVSLIPQHVAFVEAVAEFFDGHGSVALGCLIEAARRYFQDVLAESERQEFSVALAWMLGEIMKHANECSGEHQADVH